MAGSAKGEHSKKARESDAKIEQANMDATEEEHCAEMAKNATK